jgi:hypothetical protein
MMTSKSEHPDGMCFGVGGIAGPMVKLPASFGIGLHPPCRLTIVLAQLNVLSATTSRNCAALYISGGGA